MKGDRSIIQLLNAQLTRELTAVNRYFLHARMYRQWGLKIAACETARDCVSREIREDILDDTEEHIDWIETQLELIAKVGLQDHLQSQMDTGSPS